MNNAQRIDQTRTPIILDDLKISEYQKENTQTAVLRQVVVSTAFYQTQKPNSGGNDSLYDDNEFQIEEKKFTNTENRMAFLNVPSGETSEDVTKRLESFNTKGACIYRVLSNHPYLSDDQISAIENKVGTVTKDTIANRQVVRYPKGHPQENKIALQNAKPQYRVTLFSKTPREDEDLRDKNPENFYMTPEILEELSLVYENVGNE